MDSAHALRCRWPGVPVSVNMDQTLNQLGGLVLGAVPTMIFFVVLVFLYNVLVYKPLQAVLADRRSRTTGAVEQARGAIAAAEAETAVYEDKLRAAKAEIFATREQRLKHLAAERDAALQQVRATMQDRVRSARQEIEASAGAARQQIDSLSDALSEQVMRAVLPAGHTSEATQ